MCQLTHRDRCRRTAPASPTEIASGRTISVGFDFRAHPIKHHAAAGGGVIKIVAAGKRNAARPDGYTCG
jgi:hypothetical protein